MKKILVICGGFFLLASCTLTPTDTGRAYMFALTPAQTARQAQIGDSLTVALPAAAPELDTYRIALIQDDGRWDYYAGARWAEFLPLLIQDSVTKTLEDAKLFKTVATDQAGNRGEQILNVGIRSFQAEYKRGSKEPVVKIRLMVSLKNRVEGTPVASFEIKTEAKAAQDRLPDIQAAFASAFSDAQKQMVYK